ncbi:ComF family protein [Streptomyces asoensis]|uniref:ComF family protein n=2 Tax=Streptomyces TaxID=1883 RepID=UPI0037127F6D
MLPAECGGCGSPRTVLCPRCRTALGAAGPFRVRPVPRPPGLPAVHAAARYADEVRAVLLAHKERGALALARPLGSALAGAVRAGLGEAGVGEGEGEAPRSPAGVLLVPVPSARAAVRARGHDPARRIALAAAGELRRAGVPARVAAVLRQRRAVADQSGLDARGRLDNLVGALTVVPGGVRVLRGGPVVLVDDVVTTGASLAEAARAVRAATAAERAVRGESGGSGDRAEEVVGAPGGVGATAVYAGFCREGRKESSGAEEEGVGEVREPPPGGACGAGDVLCAAVVAASPDSPEINRN